MFNKELKDKIRRLEILIEGRDATISQLNAQKTESFKDELALKRLAAIDEFGHYYIKPTTLFERAPRLGRFTNNPDTDNFEIYQRYADKEDQLLDYRPTLEEAKKRLKEFANGIINFDQEGDSI